MLRAVRTVTRASALLAMLVLAAPALAREPAPPWVRRDGVRLVLVASGLDQPVGLASPPGDPRLFVVEQGGRIRVIAGGRLLPQPFLDVSDRISKGGERGLLGLAFHPDFARNGAFFVNWTDRDGHTRVMRFRAGRDSNRADPASMRPVLFVEQPFANHNGGCLAFGPDGKLYVGMGDGGSGGDPRGYAQNLGSLLGKLLRLDVDRGVPYAIPADNPFRRRAGARGEIWALGLRNPWRFSFDRATGDLWIGDVGQNRWEEVHHASSATPGINYGWNLMEGLHPFQRRDVPSAGLTAPILEYSHDEGCSITGGYVYRGRSVPALRGAYVFSDYCRGWIRSFRRVEGRATDLVEWNVGPTGAVTSFGEDAAGELYVLLMDGRVMRLAEAPPRR